MTNAVNKTDSTLIKNTSMADLYKQQQELIAKKNELQNKAIDNALSKELLGVEYNLQHVNKELKTAKDLEQKPIKSSPPLDQDGDKLIQNKKPLELRG